MLDVMGNRYDFTYERDAVASYLVIETECSIAVQNYQVEMLAHNPTPGILKLYIRRKDNCLKFYMNITSKMPLVWLLKRKKLNRNEFIGVLCGITKPLLEACKYFLRENSFIIDENYIYASPDLTEISLVYLPVIFDGDYIKAFKDLVIRLITALADVEESTGDNYLQRILGHVKQESFSIAEFDRALKEMVCMGGVEGSAGISDIPVSKNENFQIPLLNNSKVNVKVPETGAAAKKPVNFDRHMVKLVISQAAIALILLAVFKSGLLMSLDQVDLKSAYAGLALIVGAVDFLIIRNILLGKKKIEQPADSKKHLTEEKSVIKQKPVLKEKPVVKVIDVTGIPKGEMIENVLPPISGNTHSETVYLADIKQMDPYLQGMKDGIIENIPLTKSQFIMGRLEGQADYVCHSNAVGKLHAEITHRTGVYYIKDLNSRNGTFVNYERIDSSREYEIKNNDRIRLANCEYMFIVP